MTLDEFVVEVGMDITKLKAGQREIESSMKRMVEESTKSGKRVEAEGQKLNRFFGTLKSGAIEMAAAFVGGAALKNFIGNIVNADVQVGRFSRTLGISVEDLSAWQGAAKELGGTAEGITGTFAALNSDLMRFKQGLGSAALPVFTNLGISIRDVNGNLKTADELLLEVSDKVGGLSKRDAAGKLELFPGMNMDSVAVLSQGRRALQAQLEAQKQLGVATAQSVKQAEDATRAYSDLARESDNFGRHLLVVFGPVLTEIIKVVDNFLSLFERFGGRMGEAFGLLMTRMFGSAEELERRRQEWKQNDVRDAFKAAERAQALKKAEGLRAGARTLPAGASGLTGAPLSTITTPGGKQVTVASSAAADFQGFLGDLEKAGAPIGDLGGYNKRFIAGTTKWSEHAKGLAIDMGSMKGRDQIDPGLRGWIESHPAEWRRMLAQYHMKSGGDWRNNPDLGHVEWQGSPGAANVTNRGGDSSHSEVHIREINVNAPNATDAPGIAKELPAAIDRQSWNASANYSLTG